MFFKCRDEDGLPDHLLMVSYIFPYEAIFCNDILILTIAREKGEERAIIASLRWLNHGPAEQLAILSLLSLYLFLTQLHSHSGVPLISVPKNTHTHLLLDWIKYDITKAQPAILRERDACARIVFLTPRLAGFSSAGVHLHSLKAFPIGSPSVGHYFPRNNRNVYRGRGVWHRDSGAGVVQACAKYINSPLVIFAWIILMLSW